ncbi:MAG TPA: STAS domain-containing protein [Terriglobia bacterium]|nr:STAS domain-containing protein [Terriglobia bacterium]
MEDLTQAPSSAVLDLPVSVTMRSASDFRAEMLGHLRPGRSLLIKCDALAEADLSLLQMLVAMRKSAAQLGMTVSLDRPASGVFLQLLVRSGFLSGTADDPDNDDLFWIQGTNHHE